MERGAGGSRADHTRTWVLGVLLNNQWSFAGWGDKAVNAMLLQWFVNYNLPDGWYLTTSPIVTADWKADRGGRCVDSAARRWLRQAV